MKKMTTLYQKDPDNLGQIINKVNPDNQWVFSDDCIPTRKFDGTSCAIIDGVLYRRFDLKKGRSLPDGAIPCQDPDEITGHHPHWITCYRDDSNCQYHFLAFDALDNKEDGTYELCGEKVQGNPEKMSGHHLIKHGSEVLDIDDLSFKGLRRYLSIHDIEGIVFHHKVDGRMCKIRKSDFKIKR